MKANRKFKDKDDAVSAVIGVILMVAITVAIAATVYVYVSGMIGDSPQTTPNLQFTRDNTRKRLTVASADPGDLSWYDFVISWNPDEDNTTSLTGTITNGGRGPTEDVRAGDWIQFNETVDVTIRHEPTNTLIGSWTFN